MNILAVTLDEMRELEELSLALQKADITLPVAQHLLTRRLEVFSARKTDGRMRQLQLCILRCSEKNCFSV